MAKITLANLTYDTRRPVWNDGRTAPAWPALQRGCEPNFLRFGPTTTLEPVSAHRAMATRRRSPPIDATHSRCLIDIRSAGLRHFSWIASTAVKSRPAVRRSAPHRSPAAGYRAEAAIKNIRHVRYCIDHC